MVFIEFFKIDSDKKQPILIALDAIQAVDFDQHGNTMINATPVDHSYEDVLDLLSRYRCVTVDRELTGKEEPEEPEE